MWTCTRGQSSRTQKLRLPQGHTHVLFLHVITHMAHLWVPTSARHININALHCNSRVHSLLRFYQNTTYNFICTRKQKGLDYFVEGWPHMELLSQPQFQYLNLAKKIDSFHFLVNMLMGATRGSDPSGVLRGSGLWGPMNLKSKVSIKYTV